MKVKECLILSAGHGTRMGEIGKYIPKPLWPLFDREILYFQLSLLQHWGMEKVYINIHHQMELMERYVDHVRSSFPKLKITLLKERELLDSGGGVINCLQHMDDDTLLIINADVFYLPADLEFLHKPASDLLGLMFSIDVNPEDHYNRIVVEEGKFKRIVPPSKVAPAITFSGVSLVNRKRINLQRGPSKFFETILNVQKGDVAVTHLSDYEYIDFGTLSLYLSSVRKILLEKDYLRFARLLKDHDIFKEPNDKNYNVSDKSFWEYLIRTDDFSVGSECLKNINQNIIQIGTFSSDLQGLPLV